MRLVLLRHGESVWNKENRFTGWTDVDLSERGLAEAQQAGRVLKSEGYRFDIAYTSVLKRAIRTLWITLDELDLMWIPVERSWRLNERHYGALQGLNKAETAARYGEAQVQLWRRSYDTQPPALTTTDPRYPGHDPRYEHLNAADLPLTECLKDTVMRFLPYWHETIAPGDSGRAESPHRGAWEQLARAGEVPGSGPGCGHHRSKHPNGNPVRLRTGRTTETCRTSLPWRSRSGCQSGASCSQPRKGAVRGRHRKCVWRVNVSESTNEIETADNNAVHAGKQC